MTATRHSTLQNKEGDTVSVADLSELPSDEDIASLGPELAAIEGEIDEDDNPIIREMKAQCSRDQLDYCVGEAWKSKDHTMCKFCVSSDGMNLVMMIQLSTHLNLCISLIFTRQL